MKHSIATTISILSIFTAGSLHAENVEIFLTDMLDNTQNGYCLDIAGGKGASADPADGTQGHTCYSPLGELLVDQIFDTEKFADNILYMPEFDVCAEATSIQAGASVALANCSGDEAQAFVFSGEGSITPAADTSLCITLGDETRTGRSDTNQIKVLTLETCDEARAPYQTWATRGLDS